MWNWILGIGLALSFADFVYSSDMFQSTFSQYDGNKYTAESFDIQIKDNAQANSDFLSKFMEYYKQGIIDHGAEAIKGVCIKLLLVLFTINCSMKLALDLISGDKIKFLISETLKAGFYIFLIINWVGPSGKFDLTGLLQTGFQEIGFMAGGGASEADLKPDAIWENGCQLLSCMLNTIIKAPLSLTNTLLLIVSFVVSCYCILMTSIEMFMVRIEFYTMALLSMPLLAFAMIEQFNFLAQKAIGAVFNLAMKCCVIAFIQAVSVPFFKIMIDQVVESSNAKLAENVLKGDFVGGVQGSFMAFVTLILGLVVLLMLTKKIPALVTGLLNGTPSLSGGDMTSMAMGAVGGMATTAGVLSNMPGGGSGGQGSGGGGGEPRKEEGTTMGQLENNAKAVGQVAVAGITGGPGAAIKEGIQQGFNKMQQQAQSDSQGGNQAMAQDSGNTQGASPNGSGGADSSGTGDVQTDSSDGKMPDTGATQDGKAADDAKQDAPDTNAQGSDDQADAPAEQSATPDGNETATPPDTSTSTSSGSGSFSQNHPNLARAGNVAGYLAKAALMASPGGKIVNAYGTGRRLSGEFDKMIYGTVDEQPKTPEDQAKDQLINLVIADYSRKQNPNNNDEHM